MTPAPAWYEADADDADRYPETPRLGHTGADLSHSDGRNPLEPTNVYIRRLVAERDNARATIARVEAEAKSWVAENLFYGEDYAPFVTAIVTPDA